MLVRSALIALAVVVAGCNQPAGTQASESAEAPQLDAPAPESEPARVFQPAADGARSATGDLTVSIAMQMPGGAGEDAQEVLTLRGANGLVLEGSITGAVSPATQVQGQTLRALLAIPVEEPQVLVYRVIQETKPSSGQGVCGAESPVYVVVWEPSGPSDPLLKVLGVMGGAPGAAESRACPLLDYRRG
ncbi:MAG: hypothetical protein AB7O98_06465 [Hyphomonadaceae bacterium]